MTDIFTYYLIAVFILSYRDAVINTYKISYYENTLDYLAFDIEKVKNVTFLNLFLRYIKGER